MTNHERELPQGYEEVRRIDATDKKTGIIMNVVAFLVMIAVALIGLIPVFTGRLKFETGYLYPIIMCAAIVVLIPVYMVLHELVHGVAYKALTREKLTYGFSWSCAYCGVPNIYVYRGAALIAVTLPLIVFTLVFLPLAIVFAYVNTYVYLGMIIMLATHIGGCVGDIYVTLLLLFRHRRHDLLVRDTGPEQIFYQSKIKKKKKKKKS